LFRAIEFLSDELAMPGENRIGLDDVGYFLQSVLTQLLSELSQSLAFGVGEPHAPLNLMAQDAIFSHEILVSQQEFLINGARDIGQQRFPIHVIIPPIFVLIALDYRSRRGAE
jgi:hypothetical protein